MNEGTNEHCMLLVLQSAVARWSAVDRIGTLTVTTFPPIRRHDSLAAVEGRGAVSGGGGKNHLPPPPPPVAFRTSSINVKRANSRETWASFAF